MNRENSKKIEFKHTQHFRYLQVNIIQLPVATYSKFKAQKIPSIIAIFTVTSLKTGNN